MQAVFREAGSETTRLVGSRVAASWSTEIPIRAGPDLPHYGAGEAVCKPLIAAVANAIYDATGVRLCRVPFRDERVLAALEAAGV